MDNLLLIDMDGVLCAYNERLIEMGLLKPEQLTRDRWADCPLSVEQKAEIRRAVYTPGFFLSLSVKTGASDAITELVGTGWNVYACSRPPSNHFGWGEKYLWIQR